MVDDEMADDEIATTHESGALAHVHEANMHLRQVVHQFLTQPVTLTPEEALQTQRELAALGLGTAWLHARVRDSIASTQHDEGAPMPLGDGARVTDFTDSPDRP